MSTYERTEAERQMAGAVRLWHASRRYSDENNQAGQGRLGPCECGGGPLGAVCCHTEAQLRLVPPEPIAGPCINDVEPFEHGVGTSGSPSVDEGDPEGDRWWERTDFTACNDAGPCTDRGCTWCSC